MIGPALGPSILSGQLALIEEIARNIGGDPLPPAAATETPELIVSPPGEGAETPDGETLLSDRATAGPVQSSIADLLVGLRAPASALTSGADYRQVILQLASGSAADAAPASTAASGGASETPGNVLLQTEEMPQAEMLLAEMPQAEMLPNVFDPKSASRPIVALPAAHADFALDGGQGEREAAIALKSETSNASAVKLAHDTPPPAPTGLATAVDHSLPDQAIERARLALGLAEGADAGRSIEPEGSGILPSFILNAHFQPGWPPLRPIQDVDAKAFVQQLASEAELGKDDIAMLIYLANFGLKRKQLSRLLKIVAAAGNRSKLLDALGGFFSTVGVALGALKEELELLAEELEASREQRGKRSRLDLR